MADLLTEQEYDALANELVTTIFDQGELNRFVGLATGESLFDYWVLTGGVVPGGLVGLIGVLLRLLDKKGELQSFAATIYGRRPKRHDIREYLEQLLPGTETASVAPILDYSVQRRGLTGINRATPLSGLQRVVNERIPFIDLEELAQFTKDARGHVCKLELATGALGTGFLVGPSAILTNWHVVEKAHRKGLLGQVGCRFDYAVRLDGARNEGTLRPLAAAPLICHRPYAPAEATSKHDDPPQKADELDYALLQTAEPLGDERGWFALPDVQPPLAFGDGLIIVQHPDGAPVKIALDTSAAMKVPEPANRPRLRYATNTRNGSSGSPVFTMKFELAALHHLGDPTWPASPAPFNQGIPITLIQDDIVSSGFGNVLG